MTGESASAYAKTLLTNESIWSSFHDLKGYYEAFLIAWLEMNKQSELGFL